MLPPRTFRPLLRYFDAIDAVVAERLLRKRPWSEISLTSLLCDLMDEDTEAEHCRKRDLEWLRRKLVSVAPLVDVQFAIETHEYPPAYERWVTQSDLGLVLRFEDYLLHDRDWEKAFLLQAKRLYADRAGAYRLGSVFGGFDADQHERANAINQQLGYDLVRYLLYCPRPERLPHGLAEALRHLRDVNVQDRLFDGLAGLEMHNHLVRTGETLDPGIVVVRPGVMPDTFGATYGDLFSSSMPWAWFLTLWMTAHQAPSPLDWDEPEECLDAELEALMVSIVSGDEGAVSALTRLVEGLDDTPIPILPAHTITVSMLVDPDADVDQQAASL